MTKRLLECLEHLATVCIRNDDGSLLLGTHEVGMIESAIAKTTGADPRVVDYDQDVLDTCTDYPCPELTVHHSPESADGVATVNIGSLRVYIDYSAATARGTGGLLLVDVQDADGKQTPFECFGNADVRFTQVDRETGE